MFQLHDGDSSLTPCCSLEIFFLFFFVGNISKIGYYSDGGEFRMKEMLSAVEIKDRFDSEWVLIGNPEIDDTFNVKKCEVLCHSKDRDEVYRMARKINPNHSAILYTGKLQNGAAIVL